MKTFTYHNPVEIHFGGNTIQYLSTLVKNRKTLLLTAEIFDTMGVTTQIKNLAPSVVHTIDKINELPTFKLLEQVYRESRAGQPFELIVALGGGSVLDSAKIISVHREKQRFSAQRFAFVKKLVKGEVPKVGYGRIPVIAIPTTAGTGSDVTPWATAWDAKAKKKYSLHLPDLWCEATICDPMLTLSLSKNLTIHGALDALSHCLESIWNKNANPMSAHHAIHGAKKILKYLPRILEDFSNIAYRTKLMKGALHAGLAFSNTQTALAHAISYYITAHKGVPHGLACSFTLPAIIDAVAGENEYVDKALKNIFGSVSSEPLRKFFEQLKVSTNFADYNLTEEDLVKIGETLASNQRAKNSLVDSNRFFCNLRGVNTHGAQTEL